MDPSYVLELWQVFSKYSPRLPRRKCLVFYLKVMKGNKSCGEKESEAMQGTKEGGEKESIYGIQASLKNNFLYNSFNHEFHVVFARRTKEPFRNSKKNLILHLLLD